MEIRKGPYGHFAVKKIDDIGSLHSYTRGIVEENIPGHMLPLYVIPGMSSYEVSYDFSGLTSVFSLIPNEPSKINKLRKAFGDLFFSLSFLPDYLLSPAAVAFDGRFIFTDEDYSELKVCFDPVKTDPRDLNIRSLSSTGFRSFITSGSLSGILMPDEIDGLIYAAEQNDEELFRKEAEKIRLPLEEPEVKHELPSILKFKAAILMTVISVIFTFLSFYIPACLCASAGLVLIAMVRNEAKNKTPAIIPEETDGTRKEMLFGDNERTVNAIDALVLSYEDKASGRTEQRAVYTDSAAIGSDRFLCDIYIEDPKTSPVHALMRKSGRNYYVRDISSDNMTFLDNIRLDARREYEIKNGQSLICGETEFRIEIL